MQPEFEPFPKIARLLKDTVVTEKIDGTNAQILITEDGDIYPGSRKRWITVGDDNFGFAAWVQENRDLLLQLGPGQHFGEWWGRGIQRNYSQTEKHFSLFNVGRWYDDGTPNEFLTEKSTRAPACCRVVPVLATGPVWVVNSALKQLGERGSRAAPGFMNPEGVIVFHTGNGTLFKRTFDESPKGAAA